MQFTAQSDYLRLSATCGNGCIRLLATVLYTKAEKVIFTPLTFLRSWKVKQQNTVNRRAILRWAVRSGLLNSVGPGASFLQGALSFLHLHEVVTLFVQGISREMKHKVPASPVAT